jgi:hypothetical protein
MDTHDLIALLGVVLGGIAFIVGFLQYLKAQAWKQAEFVAAEMKAMFSDPYVKFALHLLDWNETTYDLRLFTGDDRLRAVHFSDLSLAAALTPHCDRPKGFNKAEVQIRQAFDELFGRMQQFEHYMKSNLVKEDSVLPYLRYWLDLIANPSDDRKPIGVLHGIWRYIAFYRYDDVQHFFERYGYNIAQFPQYLKHLANIDPPEMEAENENG